MRLRIERAERRGLDDAASHLLRPQPCHGKGRPVLLRLGMIAEAGGFKNPRGGDRTDETMKIEINGKLGKGVVSKDIILYIIAKISASGATGFFVFMRVLILICGNLRSIKILHN